MSAPRRKKKLRPGNIDELAQLDVRPLLLKQADEVDITVPLDEWNERRGSQHLVWIALTDKGIRFVIHIDGSIRLRWAAAISLVVSTLLVLLEQGYLHKDMIMLLLHKIFNV